MENKKGDVLTKKFWYFILGICIFLSVVLGVSIYLFANRKERGSELFISRLTFVLGFTFFVLCTFISFM